MECPKCGAEIDKSALVCPNCKKVLKIICPVCKTVNNKNICKKCGEILVTKCANCGKINMMKNGKCVKCGYSTELSALQAESNAETFAVVKIEFPNKDIIKTALGSNQAFTKFQTNLDNLINGYVKTLGLRRQILKDGTYLIRFNKVYTFNSSANSAITAVIDLVNMITKLNLKLLNKKNITLKTNFTLMKRNADQNPYDINTGFEANMINRSNDKSEKILDSCQIITDEDFYELYNNNYKLESLDTVLVNGSMRRFFEINIKDKINLENFENELQKEQEDVSELPNFVQEALSLQDKVNSNTISEMNSVEGEYLYNIDLINFDEINCAFYTTENLKVLDNVVEVLKTVPNGIIAIKAPKMYQPYTLKLISAVDEIGLYQNIIPITCYDNMKYSPYAFFREFISTIFDYASAQKLVNTNDFELFSDLENGSLIVDLISLKQREMENIEETRNKFFEVFLSLFQSIPDTLIYIENYEKIDSASKFVLSLLFEHFDELKISYMISYDNEFSLHKTCHFLLSRPYYTEISIVPSPIESIVAENEVYYKNIIEDFYFKRIIKYCAGSTLFLDYSLQYLVESGVYKYSENSIVMVNPKTIVIPSDLNSLIKRRLNIMKNDQESLIFLTMCLILGQRVDFNSAKILGFENWKDIADRLAEKGYLYFYNDCIYFPNYNLLKENILSIYDDNGIKYIAQNILNRAFLENIPAVEKAFIYEKLDNHQKVIQEWESLANLNLSLGDFASYLNCSGKLLSSLDNYSSDWTSKDLELYKSSIYTNISNNMFEYDPEQTREIADRTLEDLKNTKNNSNFVDLCSKMIQGALTHGYYMYALELNHKALSSLPNSSIDPVNKAFDMNFLLLSISHVKILFNIGAFKDCIDVGYNILNVLDNSKINSIKFNEITKEEFISLLIEASAYIAISDVVTLRENVCEFLEIINKLFDFIPKEYEIFIQLQNLLKGENVVLDSVVKGENVFSNILYNIINAFVTFKDNPEAFAKEIYKSKIIAKDSSLYSFELFSDLLIAYSYMNFGNFNKASNILHSIDKTAKDKGINIIAFITRYFMSVLNIKQRKFEIAYGILNNSVIQMEKLGGVSDYLIFLMKINMYKLLSVTESSEKAEICLNQAKYIAQKYGLNFDLNIDMNEFMKED